MISGDTSSHESSDDFSQDADLLKEQKRGLLALNAKDLKTSSEQLSLADYGVKQVAYALGGALPCILPSDLLELGGETDSSLKVFRVGIALCMLMTVPSRMFLPLPK